MDKVYSKISMRRQSELLGVARSTGRFPEIFNTDQSSQITSAEWTGRLTELNVENSMGGRGRWMDNVFIEWLWRSVKYEEIYLKDYATIPELQQGLGTLFNVTTIGVPIRISAISPLPMSIMQALQRPKPHEKPHLTSKSKIWGYPPQTLAS